MINVLEDSGIRCLSFEGVVSSPDDLVDLLEDLSGSDQRDLVLEMSSCESISSYVLQAIMSLYDRFENIVILKPSPGVLGFIKTLNLQEVFKVMEKTTFEKYIKNLEKV